MAQTAAPAVKASADRKKYQALTNLSIPQVSEAGLATGQNDLIPAGEIVELTEAQARNLMATGPRAGRQTPAIRPAAEAKGDLPRLLPRQLSGALRVPAPPPPDSEMPRPDPPGSSKVVVTEPPEATEPQPGDEQKPPVGAMDIPPRSAR